MAGRWSSPPARGHDGVIGPRFNALGADWVIFLAAARAVFSHDLAHIYDQAWITGATNSQFAHWLSAPLPFPLFPYPPRLPAAGAAVRDAAGGAVAAAEPVGAVRAAGLGAAQAGAGQELSVLCCSACLLAPAASNNVLAGSNAVLVAALIVGGIALLADTAAAGRCAAGRAGVQAAISAAAAAGAARGAERAGRSPPAIASAAALCVLSALLFGPQLWLDWFNVYLHPQAVAGVNATDWGHSGTKVSRPVSACWARRMGWRRRRKGWRR